MQGGSTVHRLRSSLVDAFGGERFMAQRIGILLVHGIGTQNRFEHLANVTKNFVTCAGALYGKENVTVEQPAAREGTFRRVAAGETGAEDVWKDVERPWLTVLIRANGSETAVDFREMWWHDLGARATLGSLFLFWLWVISLAGTHGYFERDRPDAPLRSPINRSTERNGVAFTTRYWVFWWTNLFFLLLLPVRMLIRVVAFIPGLGRIDVFRTVFAYMSSVQMYQKRERKHGAALTDFGQSRRTSIQRRFANYLVDMAIEKYDRWYIVGHSLGSVIAFKGLMSPGNALARYMSINRWGSRDLQEFISTSDSDVGYPDEPRCPHWLDPQRCTRSPSAVFTPSRVYHLRFAPRNIRASLAGDRPGQQGKGLPRRFRVAEFLRSDRRRRAPPARSFAHAEAISPKNFCCASSRRVWQAHTRYFHMPGRRKPSTLPVLVEWMVGSPSPAAASASFADVAERRGLSPLTERKIRWRRRLAGAQLSAFSVLGFLFWPLALAYIGRVVGRFRRVPLFGLDDTGPSPDASQNG